MEANITIIFCDLYFNLKNKIILITLNNSQELNGYINGYYYEDLDAKDKKVAMWHFVKTEEYIAPQRLQLSNSNSLLIKHKHIKEIKYLDNNSNFQTIKFTS